MRKLNFGPNFTNGIRTCYTNIECCVHGNGFTSIYFNLLRRIKPAVPDQYIFIYFNSKILDETVRKESEIKGITLPDGLVSKWVGYSDDGNATLSEFTSVEKCLYSVRNL